MPTLTSSGTFSIGAASPSVQETVIVVIAAPSTNQPGKGRLIHPEFGVLDYSYAPNKWRDIDGDLIVGPVYASSKTLQGSANTIWAGDIRDAAPFERWTSEAGGIIMPIGMLRSLIQFYTTPPLDPTSSWITWYPSYTTELGYRVLMTSLTVGGDGITLDAIASRRGWVRDEVVITYKVVGRA
jgi:hypothetical protein